jgi:hypothetical protein
VRITGRFGDPTTAEVIFGEVPGEVTAATEDAIDCRPPPAVGEGPVDVRVATAAGGADLRGGYRYLGDAFVRADSNGDGNVDISDAISVLHRLVLGGEEILCPDAIDADDDGVMAITDAIYILEYLFLDGASIPPPGPEPGYDGTPDGMVCATSG